MSVEIVRICTYVEAVELQHTLARESLAELSDDGEKMKKIRRRRWIMETPEELVTLVSLPCTLGS